MSRALDQRDRDRIPRHLVDEMVPFSPEELADFVKAFAQRRSRASKQMSSSVIPRPTITSTFFRCSSVGGNAGRPLIAITHLTL
jgi:hypothetical protein